MAWSIYSTYITGGDRNLVVVGVEDEREAAPFPDRRGQEASSSRGALIAPHGEGQGCRSRPELTGYGGGDVGVAGARVRVRRVRGGERMRPVGPD
jgi:hypothetical protein